MVKVTAEILMTTEWAEKNTRGIAKDLFKGPKTKEERRKKKQQNGVRE